MVLMCTLSKLLRFCVQGFPLQPVFPSHRLMDALGLTASYALHSTWPHTCPVNAFWGSEDYCDINNEDQESSL